MTQEELEQLWWEIERERVKNDLYYLCKEYLGYKDLNEGLHKPVADALMVWDDVLILMPRGHLKSSVVTIGKTVQLVLQNQNIRIKIVNASYDKAVEFLRSIKAHLQNDRLIKLFPEVLYENPSGESDLWRENSINVKRTQVIDGATVEALGIDSTNVGKHCNVVIFDDVHDDKNTRNYDQIKYVKSRIKLFEPILEPGGLRIFVGTRWAKEDVYGDLIKQGIRYIRREATERGKVIFPEKFTIETLQKIKKRLGTKQYYLQYLNKIFDEEDITFKDEWIKYLDKPRIWDRIYILCDPAISLKEDSADTVIQTVAQSKDDNKLCVLRSYGFKARVQDIVNEIFLEYLKYAKDYEVFVGIEKVGYQHALHQWIEKDQKTYGIYFRVHELEPHGRSKDFRIRALSPLFERGQILLNKEGCEELDRQLREYGGTHKVDHVDILSYILDVLMDETDFDVLEAGVEDFPFEIEAIIEQERELSYLDY